MSIAPATTAVYLTALLGRPMPVQAAQTEPTEELPLPNTWLDWLPEGTPEPDLLLTGPELQERLIAAGVEIAGRTLRHWQALGMVPRPLRRWHNGQPAALYPEWMVDLLATAKVMRDDGVPIDRIASRLRAIDWSHHLTVDPEVRLRLVTGDAYINALRRAEEAISDLAWMRMAVEGTRPVLARLRVYDARGFAEGYLLDLNLDPSDEPHVDRASSPTTQ